MKAMILAAGRGERMRPLTDHTPKPLLKANGKPIIQYTIEQLVSSGFTEIVINIAHLGQQIKQVLGNGEQWGASLNYSDEGDNALETAGGIKQALPLLGDEPFIVVNGDIAHHFDLTALRNKPIKQAHLVLIPNPPHHPEGDFHMTSNHSLNVTGKPRYTFSGIGVYHPQLFAGIEAGKTRLAPILRQAMTGQNVSGELFEGFWMDIGTVERLQELNEYYRGSK